MNYEWRRTEDRGVWCGISTFQLFNFSTFQLFNFSTFQLFNFSTIQLFNCPEGKSTAAKQLPECSGQAAARGRSAKIWQKPEDLGKKMEKICQKFWI
jgi:hypothetical protein